MRKLRRVSRRSERPCKIGLDPGPNLRIDIRSGVDNEELREKAKELVGLAPDVVLAWHRLA